MALTALLPAAALLLSGCSSVPDAVNPVEWYKGTAEWISGEDEVAEEPDPDAPKLSTEGVPGVDGSFPNLASVPEKPEIRTTLEDREWIAEGLIADRQNATYGGKVTAGPSIEVPPPPPPTLAVLEVNSPAPVAAITPNLTPSPAPQPAPTPGAAPSPPQPSPLAPVPAPLPAAPAPTIAVAAAETAEFLISSSAVPSGVARGLAILDLERAGTGSPIAIIFFANGSSHLSANDRAMLGKVAGAQRTSGGALRVVGHASSPTNAKDLVDQRLINFEVSLDRASAAMEELIRHGVPAASIHSDAVSANRPVSNESLPGGVASNRRVEIFLDY